MSAYVADEEGCEGIGHFGRSACREIIRHHAPVVDRRKYLVSRLTMKSRMRMIRERDDDR